MSITAYTGLMGSGKSYECVTAVIVPAVRSGRRVVTNIDGVDEAAIKAYIQEKFGTAADRLGSIVHVSNEDCRRVDFLPYGESVDTIVRPGDLVCIDEAWRVWGTSEKILKQHSIFFREHRHYVGGPDNIACDLVVMVQDISDLHRILKLVVELSFRTKKLKTLGLHSAYVCQMWEGYKQTSGKSVRTEQKRYDKEIFPLYSSYSGGAGKEARVDKRQSVFSGGLFVGMIAAAIVFAGSVWWLWGFFHPASMTKKPALAAVSSVHAAGAAAASPGAAEAPAPAPLVTYSAEWRIAGVFSIGAERTVVLIGSAGRLRYESPSLFTWLDGRPVFAPLDGQRVTWFSGSLLNPPPAAGAASAVVSAVAGK